MRGLNLLIVIYAVLCIVLGIYGAISAKEYFSLAGVLIGVLQFACLGWTRSNPRAGRIGSLVIAILVLGQFMPKFIKLGKWPAGVLSIASIILIIALLAGDFMAMSAKKRSV